MYPEEAGTPSTERRRQVGVGRVHILAEPVQHPAERSGIEERHRSPKHILEQMFVQNSRRT